MRTKCLTAVKSILMDNRPLSCLGWNYMCTHIHRVRYGHALTDSNTCVASAQTERGTKHSTHIHKHMVDYVETFYRPLSFKVQSSSFGDSAGLS